MSAFNKKMTKHAKKQDNMIQIEMTAYFSSEIKAK